MQNHIIIYIALSLDGYIADDQGGVAWLQGQNKRHQGDNGYKDFIKNIDTIIMGKKTYEAIKQLSLSWPYEGIQTYVFTHQNIPNTQDIFFVNQPLHEFLEEFEYTNTSKNIWICGGADIIYDAMMIDKVDTYHLFFIPTIIGSGIPLFKGQKALFTLERCKHENGIIHATYTKRSSINSSSGE